MGKTSRHLVIVRSVRDQHLTVAQAATRYGVSRQWVYTLLTRYDTHGVDVLTPRSKAPTPPRGPYVKPWWTRSSTCAENLPLRALHQTLKRWLTARPYRPPLPVEPPIVV